MKKLLIYYIGVSVLLLTGACQKNEDLSGPIHGLEDNWVKTPLDEWLYETFTKPYNISVDYRWNGAEVGYSNVLVPTREDRVIPLMTVVKEGWIDVYKEVAGADFVKRLSPRQYVLIGSPQYNASGTITVGSASAGSKVAIYRTNWFDTSDRAIVKRVLKTVHHEFAHILHQNIMYPEEYELLTPALYTSSWNSVSEVDARNSGFITPYAMASPSEDFAEMVGIMMTEGPEGYAEIIAGISNPDAVEIIRQKEDIVVTYFEQVWGVDYYEVQRLTAEAIDQISPLPAPDPLHTLIGPDLQYGVINIQRENITDDFSTGFREAMNEAQTNMIENYGGRSIVNIEFQFLEPSQVRLGIRWSRPSDGNTFIGYYDLDYVMNDAGDISFLSWEVNTVNSNGNNGRSRLYPLLDFLISKNFHLGWFGDPREPGDKLGAFYELDNLNNYFYGTVE